MEVAPMSSAGRPTTVSLRALVIAALAAAPAIRAADGRRFACPPSPKVERVDDDHGVADAWSFLVRELKVDLPPAR